MAALRGLPSRRSGHRVQPEQSQMIHGKSRTEAPLTAMETLAGSCLGQTSLCMSTAVDWSRSLVTLQAPATYPGDTVAIAPGVVNDALVAASALQITPLCRIESAVSHQNIRTTMSRQCSMQDRRPMADRTKRIIPSSENQVGKARPNWSPILKHLDWETAFAPLFLQTYQSGERLRNPIYTRDSYPSRRLRSGPTRGNHINHTLRQRVGLRLDGPIESPDHSGGKTTSGCRRMQPLHG